MPKAFEDCVAAGGRVRRVSGPSEEHGLDENQYVNYCFRDGKSSRGEVHTKSEETARKNYAHKAKKVGLL